MVLPLRLFAPFQLDRGLYLENAKCLLPWDVSLYTLMNIASPEFRRLGGPRKGYLNWKDEAIFEGLKADIWYDEGVEKNAFRIEPQSLQNFSTPREAFVFYCEELTPKLGKPNLSSNKFMNVEYPSAQWWFGNVRVSVAVGERFMEYLAFLITKDHGMP